MKKLFGLIFILNLTFGISMSSYANGITPHQSYLKAKRQAELDNLKYVLYFKADWCSPCQWMEETTFSDVRLQAAMNTDFLFVTLDIDAFEGYALKEFFHVQSLPTMLVFNAQHQIVNRQEGSLSASSMLKMVETEIPLDEDMRIVSKDVINNRPLSQPTTKSRAPVAIDTRSAAELPANLMSTITKYGVQLGAFSSFENAKAIQSKASQYTTEHIEITTIQTNESTVYKVYAGQLDKMEQAQQLQRTLASYGLTGFTKAILIGSKS